MRDNIGAGDTGGLQKVFNVKQKGVDFVLWTRSLKGVLIELVVSVHQKKKGGPIDLKFWETMNYMQWNRYLSIFNLLLCILRLWWEHIELIRGKTQAGDPVTHVWVAGLEDKDYIDDWKNGNERDWLESC